MDFQEIERICYRILLSIGDSLELRKMVGKSLAAYMQDLECSMGAVLIANHNESGALDLRVSYAVPRSLERHDSFKKLMEELSHVSEMKDMLVIPVPQEAGGGTYYVMSMADIGLLVLHKNGDILDHHLLEALRPLNHKLGTACEACLQNTALQTSSLRFMEMANMLPGLIFELNQDYKITFFNRRTQEIFKQIDSDGFHPDSIDDFFPAEEVEHIHAVLDTMARGRKRLVSDDFWMINSRGQRFKVNMVVSPIHSDDQVVGFRGIATDITERVRLEEQQKTLLVRVSDRVRELDCLFSIVKLIADDSNSLSDIFQKALPFIATPFDAHQQLDVGIMYKDKVFGTFDPEENRSIQEAFIHSGTDLRGKVAVQAETGYVFTEEEKRLVASLGTQFSAIVAKKETEEQIKSIYDDIMEDLDTAQTIQSYILPRWFKAEGSVIFSANYRPWAQIGGDLFDCLMLSDSRYVLYVADISGHGVQAALIMMAVKSVLGMILSSARPDCTPAEIVTRLNRTLSEGLFKDNYMTMCFCIVDTDSMTVSSINAGHPPMAIINRNRSSMRVLAESGDIPLGWDEQHVYLNKDVIVEPISHGDMLCLYTDGVFECTNAKGEALSLEQFLDLLENESKETQVAMLPQDCHAMLDRKGFTARQDDFTFVAMQVIEPSEYSTVLELPANLEMVDRTAQELADFVMALGKTETDAWKCRLVAGEFMNNIIVHGLENSIDEIIALEVSVCADEIILTIRDRASAWSMPPESNTPEQFFDSLNLVAESHGRGMQIIYSLTSRQARRRIYHVNETMFTIPTPTEVS